MRISHLICTVRPCLIHTCHAAPMPCSDHAVLCCGLEKNGMVRAWHGRGMASVNQTRPHCANQMGNTHSKPLAARHGRGTSWARHAMCVNRPLYFHSHIHLHGLHRDNCMCVFPNLYHAFNNQQYLL